VSEKVKVDQELKFASNLLKPVLAKIREHEGVISAMHVCRGNWTTDESVLLSGAYSKLSKFFSGLKVDMLALEFSTPRAGEVEELFHNNLLAKKINSLKIFFKLLDDKMDNEQEQYLDECLIRCYASKGINHNNKSLYDRNGNLRKMPILGDLLSIVEENKNLQIKDLITLGLYTILLILVMAVGIGISTLLTSVIFGGKVYFATYTSITAALVCGSVYSLIFNKINKNMAIFIMIAIIGIFMSVSGHSIVGGIVLIFAAVLAEIAFRYGNEYLSYLFFNLGNIGIILPMFFMKDSYVKHLQNRNYSDEKINLVMSSTDMKTFIFIVVFTIIFSIIGTYLGRKLYFKNFNKAGL